jgi:hypothetical protein
VRTPTARLLYDNAERISLSANDIEHDHSEASQNQLAYVMLLDVVLTSPAAVIRSLPYLRDDMVKADLGARLSAAAKAQAVLSSISFRMTKLPVT